MFSLYARRFIHFILMFTGAATAALLIADTNFDYLSDEFFIMIGWFALVPVVFGFLELLFKRINFFRPVVEHAIAFLAGGLVLGFAIYKATQYDFIWSRISGPIYAIATVIGLFVLLYLFDMMRIMKNKRHIHARPTAFASPRPAPMPPHAPASTTTTGRTNTPPKTLQSVPDAVDVDTVDAEIVEEQPVRRPASAAASAPSTAGRNRDQRRAAARQAADVRTRNSEAAAKEDAKGAEYDVRSPFERFIDRRIADRGAGNRNGEHRHEGSVRTDSPSRPTAPAADRSQAARAGEEPAVDQTEEIRLGDEQQVTASQPDPVIGNPNAFVRRP